MSEEMLVRHCSPTLAGMKTGNIFSCCFGSEAEMKESIRCMNRRLVKKGLRILPLRFQEGRALIYVFRPSHLAQDLQNDTAYKILTELGYNVKMSNECVLHLMRRLGEGEEFPHEIGLFLGYPPEDVCGFIENKAECCKLVGCWKVYGDVEAAKKTFAKYKKCTDVYCEHLAKGRSIERLTIAG